MTRIKFSFTIIFLLISAFCIAQSNWKLVYENDAEGNTVNGELSELIRTVQSGQSIRIYYKTGRSGESTNYVEHTTLVKFFTIMNSPNGQFVAAQIDPIVGQIPDFENQQVLLKENLEWSLIVSTNGKNDTMTKNIITGEIINHRLISWGTKWFAEK